MSDLHVGTGAAGATRAARGGGANSLRWDMAVIGAGPAGSVCAYSALAACPGMRVALVDRDTFPRDKSCGDAVRQEAAITLGNMGLGAIFDSRPPVPHRSSTYPPQFRYLRKFLKGNNPIYTIERELFDNFLLEAAVRQGAEDYTGHKLTDATYEEHSGDWVLILRKTSGESIEMRCGTLVGADGAGSRVRRAAGLSCSPTGHTSVGLRAYAQADGPVESTMRFDFTESLLPGYGWTFPLTGGKVNVGVIIDKPSYKRGGRSLKSYLDEYLHELRGAGISIGGLSGFMAHPLPLASELPRLAPKPGVALIGDAGSMVHPFTGEGIHFAIWAGRTLGSIIGQRVSRGTAVQAGLESFAEAYAARFARPMTAARATYDHVMFRKFLM